MSAESAEANAGWIEPYQGLRYHTRVMTVQAVDQARLLGLCGIDPGIYGETIDPAAFITLAIQEGVRNRVHANGTVNMGQRLIQHRPMRLGEPLTVTGEILSVEAVPRGHIATSETWFSGADGQRALTAGRRSLRPGPAMATARGASPGERAAEPELGRMKTLASFTLTPQSVKDYTGPENPIHFDPVVAQSRGYRAPITGGGQCVRFLTAQLWRHVRPASLEMDIRFRRPVFWDDTVSVSVDEREGRWHALYLVVNGKAATEAIIHSLTV